ncbi:MAG: thioredoxin domain-containing protein [Chloroflexi bacterium]|nr:thioredoxin domain-containing protein [Chloroflexota bacterium]
MGKGLVEKLSNEFDIRAEWISYEIHPETPPLGVPINRRFSIIEIDRMIQNLRRMAAPLGITFAEISLLANSRLSLAVSEFARDQGKFDQFHEQVFHAYFTLGLNIGELDIIQSLAEKATLDTNALEQALREGRYLPRLQGAQLEASRLGIKAAPTFIVEDKEYIIGVQPIEVFQHVLKQY